MDVLFFIGITIIAGFLGGKLSNRFKFPAVIGYLLIGLLLGPSVFKVLKLELLEKIGVFNDLALSVVAFIIGSEMHTQTLRRMGRRIVTIIFSESFFAFFLVALGVYLLTKKLYLALIFGAMAPASAPAGTVVVLQEYKAKGPLTDTLYAVVGLDDGLAIMIYAFAAAFAKFLLMEEPFSLINVLKGPIIDIFLAIGVGSLLGIITGYSINALRTRTDVLAICLGSILICTGLAKSLKFSLILSNLSLGVSFANLFLYANKRAFESIQFIGFPIFIIFFVIAGAHLQLKLLPAMGLLGVVYILCRTLGLVGGAFLGASISKAPQVIKKYLGLGILSQAGVAIGLAILVTREFSLLGEVGKEISLLVINTIAATTIFFEIFGPITTKIAITRAGEVGLK